VTLSPGTRLGPYEVQSAIGAGGMGEVYKARDTRLDRSVAIKVLPAELSADPDRQARFEREAKTIAGLNHPHICTLHDVGEHDGSTFLVMEHLTGETLAQRLAKGPLPLDEALEVGAQIADALSVAHRQGVIHRDLKPGNVMLTKTGAKLLDFGLAKLTGHGEQAAVTLLSSAPTERTPLTAEGLILGTLPYMAPEQVEGKAADARTDLWALGAILYEMVTGKRTFEGTSAASLIGHIMNSEPAALATLQPLTPLSVDRVVKRCLAKDPDARWQAASDVADELRWLRETSGVPTLTGVQPRRRSVVRTVLAASAVPLLIAAGAGLMWLVRPSPPVAPGMRATLPVELADELNAGGSYPTFLPTPGGSRTALTWTPDGQALIFVGRAGGVQRLYVRPLDTDQARPIPNTEGAQVPAVSPDGHWVAFWADGAIRKVALGGSAAMVLASGVPSPPWGLAWDAAGAVYFAEGPIRKISPEGTVSVVTTVGDAELSHGLPWPLPGGRVLLYTVYKRLWTWSDEEIVAETLADGTRKVLLTNAVDARYLATTGHLVFLRRGVLYAVPFDPERLQPRGVEVPVLDGVAQALTAGRMQDVTGAGQFAVAPTGALAWLPGRVTPYPDGTLVTANRRGQISPLPFEDRSYHGTLRVSPDGRRVAVPIMSLDAISLWLGDLGSGRLTPLVVEGECTFPIWSPNGQRVAFWWVKEGRWSLAVQSADGTTPPQVLVTDRLVPSSFTPDGGLIASVSSGGDILMVSAEKEQATPQPLFQTSHVEMWPDLSPDGRWLAYGSNVGHPERFDVWVRPYPGPGEAVPIDEGGSPAWAQNGRELLYVSGTDPTGKGRMMAVDFAPGSPRPIIGRPHLLFEFDPRELEFSEGPVRHWDVTPDGQRFYVVRKRMPPPPPAVTHINLIQNWFEELKAKVPRQ
jgi:serine/threonine protein kinase